MTNTPAYLAWSGVWKSFGRKDVLRGIDLEARKGECLVILGGSGSGKSVLLKTTIGLIRADAGLVMLEGKEIQDLTDETYVVVRERISYVFQLGALFDSMNVYENLAYPLRVQDPHRPETEVAAKVQESLARVNMADAVHLMPADLSGGMRKRVALARGIITNPECILYDEPTAGLDPVTSTSINELILRLQKELNVTSIVVTHDINSMRAVADRVAFLHEGRMDFVGSLEDAQRPSAGRVADFIEGRIHERQ